MFVDTILAIPPLVLLLFVVIVLGQNIQNIIIAVGILAIPTTARIVRANTLVYTQRDFVTAARCSGRRTAGSSGGRSCPTSCRR